MTFQDDPNRPRPYVAPLHDRDTHGRKIQKDGMGWGIPLGIAAVLLIAGFMFLNPRSDTTTATNNSPTVTRPAATPAPVAPASRPGVGG